MKPVYWIGLGFAGIVGIMYARKVSAANSLEFYPVGVTIPGKFKIFDPKLEFQAEIVNSRFADLNVSSIFLNLESRGKVIGRISKTEPIKITGNGTTKINLPVKLDLAEATFFAYEIIAKGIKTIDLKGRINAEGLSIPIDTKISLFE